MSIVVEKSGILTTVQDRGRTGSCSLGINVSGVMDTAAASIANLLVGNDADEAVLEMYFPTPVLRFETDALIAICGADFGCTIADNKAANWATQFVKKGDTVRFGEKVSGNISYLSVAGGFDIEPWRGSLSTNLGAGVGGFMGRPLRNGDRLDLRTHAGASRRSFQASPTLIPRYGRFPTVRVIAGAETDELTDDGKQALFSETFSISSDSNRMGFRLSGPSIERKGAELISSPVAFGAIQLLPDGQLILLMADHQTSGGYPRVAHVISRDLPLVAQLGPSDKVAFHLITIEEAELLVAEFERELKFLKVGCRLLANS